MDPCAQRFIIKELNMKNRLDHQIFPFLESTIKSLKKDISKIKEARPHHVPLHTWCQTSSTYLFPL